MKFETAIQDLDPASLSKRLAEIFAYWESKRGDHFAPAWEEFHLDELDPQSVPLSVVVDVIADPLDFVYRFHGTARARVEGRDWTGHSVRDLRPPELGEKVYRELSIVVEQRVPVHFVNKGITDQGEDLQYEFLRLPLSSDKRTVDKIYSMGFNDQSLSVLRRQFGTETANYPSGLSKKKT
ncbi:MAG: PAS domain-containing protein [Rhodospirillales bacterium]|nr:PAS domain-containing protein [Alphaproteobacteria bacterium]MBL6947092.1 PAS domain-containing protein [Rhodospirillales bacterium]